MEERGRTLAIVVGVALLVAAGLASGAPAKREPAPPEKHEPARVPEGVHPKVEVVFVLDTTGSMGGLIQGAKEKIWSIAKHIASATPTPEVTIGLVAYRDIGDAYVTKKYALSGDIDAVFEHLMAFRAEGGGDTPEHVAKGLYDAVYGMQWSEGAMKMIFLVGDAPPHVDYRDGFDYGKILKEASRREIRVHTVRCGNDPETARYWQEMARLGHGTYASIAENGGVAAVATPMDGELADLGRKLNATEIVYGDDGVRARAEHKAAVAATAPAEAAADRGAFYGRTGAKLDEDDVLDKAAERGGAGAATLDPAKLPEPMRAMTADERRAYVVKKKAEREAVVKQINETSARRDAFLKEHAKDHKEAGFDDVVKSAIRSQGKDYGLAY
jgi:hypothetical protein